MDNNNKNGNKNVNGNVTIINHFHIVSYNVCFSFFLAFVRFPNVHPFPKRRVLSGGCFYICVGYFGSLNVFAVLFYLNVVLPYTMIERIRHQ